VHAVRNKVWTIPPERLKDRRTRSEPHRIPLSRELTNVLQSLPRIGEYAFLSSKSEKPLSNMAMLTLLKKMNRDKSTEPLWVEWPPNYAAWTSGDFQNVGRGCGLSARPPRGGAGPSDWEFS
jgi:hypothetical protein